MSLPADRELRHHRQHAHGGAGRAWTARSTGSACRTSIRPACLRRSWTTRRGAASRSRPDDEDVGTSSSTGRTPTSSITRFLHADGVGEIEDFMPVGGVRSRHGSIDSIRRVRVVRGEHAVSPGVPSRVRLRPRGHTTRSLAKQGARFDSARTEPRASPTPCRCGSDERGAAADFTLGEERDGVFVLAGHSTR